MVTVASLITSANGRGGGGVPGAGAAGAVVAAAGTPAGRAVAAPFDVAAATAASGVAVGGVIGGAGRVAQPAMASAMRLTANVGLRKFIVSFKKYRIESGGRNLYLQQAIKTLKPAAQIRHFSSIISANLCAPFVR